MPLAVTASAGTPFATEFFPLWGLLNVKVKVPPAGKLKKVKDECTAENFVSSCENISNVFTGLAAGAAARKAKQSCYGALASAGMSCVGGGTLVSIIKNERPGWVSSPGALTAFLAAGCAGYYGVCKRGLSRPWVKKVSGAADLVALGGAAVAAGKEVVSGKGNLVTAALSASLCSVGGGLCCDVINGKPPSAFTRSARAFVVPPIIGAWLYPVVYNPRHPNAAVLLTVAATIGLHKALAPHSAKK